MTTPNLSPNLSGSSTSTSPSVRRWNFPSFEYDGRELEPGESRIKDPVKVEKWVLGWKRIGAWTVCPGPVLDPNGFLEFKVWTSCGLDDRKLEQIGSRRLFTNAQLRLHMKDLQDERYGEGVVVEIEVKGSGCKNSTMEAETWDILMGFSVVSRLEVAHMKILRTSSNIAIRSLPGTVHVSGVEMCDCHLYNLIGSHLDELRLARVNIPIGRNALCSDKTKKLRKLFAWEVSGTLEKAIRYFITQCAAKPEWSLSSVALSAETSTKETLLALAQAESVTDIDVAYWTAFTDTIIG
ncbi:hypothetical protein HK097_003729 [Rhizophlyctis rosea]|uniref:Uncharacterized protein n=1 Tax=Rhizophlyctis rosea TaxID=64517 RepID=A0AAD5SK58_9FUNG|nr:hypothetical protein HK097_003729 [Rhizophlyctis rosea]